jgi:hypothetical protein
MEKAGKTKTVYNFLNTCNKCFNDIEYPLLGDFSYGELIFQTSDGLDFFIVELIDNKTLDFIYAFLNSKVGQKISKADPQKILALLADKVEGKEIAIDYPICPNCKRKQNHFNDNIRTTKRQIGFATWTNFESLTVDNKTRRLEDILNLFASNLL